MVYFLIYLHTYFCLRFVCPCVVTFLGQPIAEHKIESYTCVW